MSGVGVLFLDPSDEFLRLLRAFHGRGVTDENGFFLREFGAGFSADRRQILFFHLCVLLFILI